MSGNQSKEIITLDHFPVILDEVKLLTQEYWLMSTRILILVFHRLHLIYLIVIWDLFFWWILKWITTTQMTIKASLDTWKRVVNTFCNMWRSKQVYMKQHYIISLLKGRCKLILQYVDQIILIKKTYCQRGVEDWNFM